MATVWAILKLILKLWNLAETIQVQNRVKWFNDCEDIFDKLKVAETSEARAKAAHDLANLVRRM